MSCGSVDGRRERRIRLRFGKRRGTGGRWALGPCVFGILGGGDGNLTLAQRQARVGEWAWAGQVGKRLWMIVSHTRTVLLDSEAFLGFSLPTQWLSWGESRRDSGETAARAGWAPEARRNKSPHAAGRESMELTRTFRYYLFVDEAARQLRPATVFVQCCYRRCTVYSS